MPVNYKNWPERIIPANPADLNFESEMRSNSQQLLDAIVSFDHQFVDAINTLGEETFTAGIQTLQAQALDSVEHLSEALLSHNHPYTTGHPYFVDQNKNVSLAGDPLVVRFERVVDRFEYLDGIINDAHTSGVETGMSYNSIHARFTSDETRIKTLEDKEQAAYQQNLETGKSYSSVQHRFQSDESRIKSLEDDISGFTGGGGQTLSQTMDDFVDSTELTTALTPYNILLTVPSLPAIPSSGFAVTKYLASSGNSLTWEDAPYLQRDASGNVIDPNTGNPVSAYEWVPDVAFQTMQFDGEVIKSRSLAAGFNYFIAGNLEIYDFDASGNAVTLTLESSSQQVPFIQGATLIVQGHVTRNKAGLIEDQVGTNKPRVIIQNWSTTRSDYLVRQSDGENYDGILETSFLNLEGKHIFPAPLVIDSGCELVIDTPCQLVFKKADDDSKSRVRIENDVNGDPIGTITYMDDQLAQITAINNLAANVKTVGDNFALLIQKFADLSQDHFVFEDKVGELHVHYNQGIDPANKVTQQEVDDLIDNWSNLMNGFDPTGALSTSGTAIGSVALEMKTLFLKLEKQVNRYTYSVSPDGQEITYDFTQQPIPTNDVTDWVNSWEQLITDIRDSVGSLEQLQLLIG